MSAPHPAGCFGNERRSGRVDARAGALVVWRRLLMRCVPAVTALCMATLAGPAQSVPVVKDITASGSIVVETQNHPGPNDPGRCISAVFLQFPEVPGATKYEARANALPPSAPVSGSGPPFPGDRAVDGPAVFVAPPGVHRIVLGFGSSGTAEGCANAEAFSKARFSVDYVRATTDVEPGAIEGNVVTTPSLAPVPGLVIRMVGVAGDAAGKTASAITDPKGNYKAPNLADGDYTVTPTPPADQEVTPTSSRVTVSAGATARADFRVKPQSPLKVTIEANPSSPFVKQKE